MLNDDFKGDKFMPFKIQAGLNISILLHSERRIHEKTAGKKEMFA